MKKSLIILAIAMSCGGEADAQQAPFSLYDFSSQRISPSTISLDNFSSIDGIYRSQQSLSGIALSSALFAAKYPFIRRGRGRWSAVGLSVGHDRAGMGGILQLNEVTAAYALTIRSSRLLEMSAGLQAGYRQRRISAEGLFTGRQYVEQLGFDPSLDPGENLAELNAAYLSFGGGMSMKLKDRRGERRGHAGFSLQELNTPDESVLGAIAAKLPVTAFAEGGVRLYNERRMVVYADVLYAKTRTHYFNSGVTTTYKLGRYYRNPRKAQSIDFIARYLPKMGASVGARWNDGQSFSVAAAYEVPINWHPAHQGAFEVGLKVARLEKAKAKKRRRKSGPGRRTPYIPGRRPVPAEQSPVPDTVAVEVERKTVPSDSVAGVPKPEVENPLPEKILLRYDFDFGEITPVLEKQDILKEIVNVLRQNPAASIEIIGHTDNVGSEKFNQRLSEERARVFFELLIELGIDPQRMDYRGEGELQPLNDNSTPELQRLNRRVEVVFHYLDRGGR